MLPARLALRAGDGRAGWPKGPAVTKRWSSPALVEPLSGSEAGPRLAGEPLIAALTVPLFATIYLQKLAIPGTNGSVSLPMLLGMVWLVLAHLAGILAVDARRLVLYLVFMACTLVSQALQPSFSLPSMVGFLALYAQLVFVAPLSAAGYLRYLQRFQWLMLLPASLVLIQLLSQFLLGFGRAPSIEPFLPRALLLTGYYYDAPLYWGTAFTRPNGFFFLEPSFASAFIACALLIEACHFRRPALLLLFAAALLGCLAGTGALMAVVACPFLLARLPRHIRLPLIVGLGIGLCLLLAWKGGSLFYRLEGLSVQGSSENGRLVAPVVRLLELLGDERNFLFGTGAGHVDATDSSPWPVVKVLSEYGILTTIAYMLLQLRCINWWPDLVVVLPIFVVFNFTGNYALSPIGVLLLLLFCTLPRLEPGAARRGATDAR